uniref:transposase n=1 Tax=Acidocella sp. TaxID=50710 RepID=UPI002636A23F
TDASSGKRIHVSRVESSNGFMRRAVTGVFHSISVKHLWRYTGEATFRWNRKADCCRSGRRGSTADPRLRNQYFGAGKRSAARMLGQTKALDLVPIDLI